MSLRLTCMGGAAAWPNPGQGCSSFLVQSGNVSVLLDSGPNTLLELRKHTLFSRIDAVVVSHCHSDHILDLVPYRYGLKYGPEKPDTPIPLWLPPGGTRILDALASALGGQGESTEGFWDGAFSIREYNPSDVLNIGDLSINFQRTVHAAECYAIRVEDSDGSRITYGADTGSIEPLVEFAASSKVLIAEATLPERSTPDSSAGHLMPSQAGNLAALAGVKQLVMTHLWAERPDSEVLAEIQKAFDGEVLFAKPGLIVDA